MFHCSASLSRNILCISIWSEEAPFPLNAPTRSHGAPWSCVPNCAKLGDTDYERCFFPPRMTSICASPTTSSLIATQRTRAVRTISRRVLLGGYPAHVLTLLFLATYSCNGALSPCIGRSENSSAPTLSLLASRSMCLWGPMSNITRGWGSRLQPV